MNEMNFNPIKDFKNKSFEKRKSNSYKLVEKENISETITALDGMSFNEEINVLPTHL